MKPNGTSELTKASDSTEESNVKPHKSSFKEDTLEHMALFSLLETISGRLSKLETAVLADSSPNRNGFGNSVFELIKVILGGWQVFGLLILILFYQPLNSALLSISDKLRSADEIALPGVTLKGAIKSIATQKGLADLGETLPSLSGTALELLLKAPKQTESLISFGVSTDNKTTPYISYPPEDFMRALHELLINGLITVRGGIKRDKELTANELLEFVPQMQREYPGHAEPQSYRPTIEWKLDKPWSQSDEKPIYLMWKLSEEGARGVDVVLQAVTAQLQKDGKH